jgi:hypothetical protein
MPDMDATNKRKLSDVSTISEEPTTSRVKTEPKDMDAVESETEYDEAF